MQQSDGTILGEIDGRAQKSRANIERLHEQSRNAVLELEELQRKETQLFLQLASFQAAQSKDDNLLQEVSNAEKEAFRLLALRDDALKKQDERFKALQEQIKGVEERRQSFTDKIAALNVNYDALERDIFVKLVRDEQHQQLSKTIAETQHQIDRVEQKIPLIEQDKNDKIKAYHDDSLFMFLKGIEYGTKAYKRTAVQRMLDKWVARISGFEDARRNYRVLSALPQKFMDHLTALETKLDDVQAQLEAYIRAAVLKDGGDKLAAEIEAYEQDILGLDQELLTLESQLGIIQDVRHEIITGQDTHSKEAQKYLGFFLKNKSLDQLKREAANSPSPEDDEIVLSLYDLEKQKSSLSKSITDYEHMIISEERRLSDVQQIRKDYKDYGYDKRPQGKAGGSFSVLLEQVLSKTVKSDIFWRGVGKIFEEILDELDLDDVFEFDDRKKYKKYRKHKHYNKHKYKKDKKYKHYKD